MKAFFGKVTSAVLGALTVVGVVAIFFAWGAFHQVMSFADCPDGKPEMTLTAIAMAGIGITSCSVRPAFR